MSTSSNSGVTSTTFAPLQFTGISQYSSDFQSILTRAGAIAQLPVTALQNKQATIQQQELDLSTLGAAATAVGSALTALGQLGAGQALSATSSDSKVVTATNTGATAGTSYSITNVTSIASSASETSLKSYLATDTVSTSPTQTMQLVVGNKPYTITLDGLTLDGKGIKEPNTLTGLENAINNSGAGVTASILTTSSGNYLAVAANSPGVTPVQIIDSPLDNPKNIITSNNPGTNTNFELNGIAISEPSTTINDVIPGVTLNFAGTTAQNETVSVNLATNSSNIQTALQTLVSSYNTLATAESAQFGTGSLTGNSIIYQIRQAMSSLLQNQGTGSMNNIASLGIEMDKTGHMSLNQQTFSALSNSQIASSLQLLGTSTTGIGGLQQTFSSITDPISGSVQLQESQWATTVTNLTDEINTKNTQNQAREQTLNRLLQAADAASAQLASQQSILTASIASLDFTSYGKTGG